jgi:hypothetical protein
MSANTLVIIVIVVIGILGLWVIPRILLKRAINQVLRRFRDHKALSVKNAKTVEELELVPKGIFEGMLQGRDYKPYALDMMKKGKIIMATEDDKLYLSEEKLAASKLYTWQSNAAYPKQSTQKASKKPRFPL